MKDNLRRSTDQDRNSCDPDQRARAYQRDDTSVEPHPHPWFQIYLSIAGEYSMINLKMKIRNNIVRYAGYQQNFQVE